MKHLPHIVAFAVICTVTVIFIKYHSAKVHNDKLEENATYMAASRENSVTTVQIMDIAKGEFSHEAFSVDYVCPPKESQITVKDGIYKVCSFYESFSNAPLPHAPNTENSLGTDDKYLAFAFYTGMVDAGTAQHLDEPLMWHHTVTMISALLDITDMETPKNADVNSLKTMPRTLYGSRLYNDALKLFNMGIAGNADEYLNFDPYAPITDMRLDGMLLRVSDTHKRIKIRSINVQSEKSDIQTEENSCIIPLNAVLQNPELPTGCEVTSLTSVLNYIGFDVDKCTMADEYLSKGEIGKTDYRCAFVGNPREEYSYGCFSHVIVECANKYLAKKGSYLKAYDVSDQNLEDLYTYLDQGVPVIIWATIGLDQSFESDTWIIDSEEVTWYANEHCVVLHGYDKDKNVVYVADPLVGNVEYKRELFEKRYNELFKQAVVIK